MERQVYTGLDDKVRWFDREKAEKWQEDTYWNGNNHISKATGSQWDHQELYRTRKGSWVLYRWSQWQGSGESWTEITKDEALQWLLKSEYEIPEELPVDDLEG